MFCTGCGKDRTVPASAASPGPCPGCGSTARTSVQPDFSRFPLTASGPAGPIKVTITGGANA